MLYLEGCDFIQHKNIFESDHKLTESGINLFLRIISLCTNCESNSLVQSSNSGGVTDFKGATLYFEDSRCTITSLFGYIAAANP